jgi:diamine N-acetyltransferase
MRVIQLEAQEVSEIQPLWEKLNKLHHEKSTFFKSHFERFRFDERIALLSGKDEFAVFVAKQSDVSMGYCIASVVRDAGEIDSIFIDTPFRQQGVGHALMDAAESWLASKQVTKMTIDVAEGNESVIGFYKARGFLPRMIVLQK